jgi:putative ABC transport system ATP-binding protein
VLRLLRAAVDRHQQTIVMVTHDPFAAAHADRVLFLADGRLVDELVEPTGAQEIAVRTARLEESRAVVTR